MVFIQFIPLNAERRCVPPLPGLPENALGWWDYVALSRGLAGSAQQAPSRLLPAHEVHVRANRGGRDGEGAGPKGPGVPDPRSHSPSHGQEATAGPNPDGPTSGARAARSGSRFPGGADPGCYRKAAPPIPRRDQASPCLASLWPRRSGPRPRTSPGGCGSWSSALRRLTLQTWPGGSGIPRSPSVSTLREGLPVAAWGRAQARDTGSLGVVARFWRHSKAPNGKGVGKQLLRGSRSGVHEG